MPSNAEDRNLLLAAREDNCSQIETLVEAGADVDCTDEDASTPLHYVANNGCSKCTKYLLEMDADVTATDTNGQRPLQVAWQRRSKAPSNDRNKYNDVLKALVDAELELSGHEQELQAQSENIDSDQVLPLNSLGFGASGDVHLGLWLRSPQASCR